MGPNSLELPQTAQTREPSRHGAAVLVASLLVVAPAMVDLLFVYVNPSVVYVIPLFVFAQTQRRKVFRQMAVFLVLLPYACYFAKAVRTGELVSYRLFNRTLVVAALAVVAVLLHQWIWQRELAQLRNQAALHELTGEQQVFEQILESTRQFTVRAAAVGLAGAIFVADLLTPGQFNLPILYLIPLCAVAWTGSRRWVVGMAGGLCVLAVLGWTLGAPPTVADSWWTRLVVNRSLAIGVLVVLGGVLAYWNTPRAGVIGGDDRFVDPYGG